MDDAAAIRSCRAGDADAFRYLVERYQKHAMAHAVAILGNRTDAEDALQEAFLDAYRALDRFDEGRSFYSWFYTILRIGVGSWWAAGIDRIEPLQTWNSSPLAAAILTRH